MSTGRGPAPKLVRMMGSAALLPDLSHQPKLSRN